ncbi:hypothetical protein BDW72DRAFT_198190 [Aspergillus terricola var. indicus]
MERWRNSPPEDEAALIPDIVKALREAAGHPNTGSQCRSRNTGQAFRHYRTAASTTSGESSASSRGSQLSERSGSSSQGQSQDRGSCKQLQPRGGRVGRPAGQNPRKKQADTNALRRYCCTFCCDRFKTKYDWARHEKSVHVSLDAWYCAPFGTTVPEMHSNRRTAPFVTFLTLIQSFLTNTRQQLARVQASPVFAARFAAKTILSSISGSSTRALYLLTSIVGGSGGLPFVFAVGSAIEP